MSYYRSFFSTLLICATFIFDTGLFAQDPSNETAEAQPEPVSYSKDILPIFQANCWGCHQPAKSLGEYVITEFELLISGGESGDTAVVAEKPDESYLLELVTPDENGEADMPQDSQALSSDDVALIRRWIIEGAKNDSRTTTVSYSASNPPVYNRLPVITSLDHSPGGKLLAVAGFHEVLLIDLSTRQIMARLIGLSPRIESLRFSPDGSRLAVAGGRPGMSGEVQVWNVESGKLDFSKAVSHDTVYGISWSPDGKRIAFGLTDTTLRAIDSQTGEQVLFQGAHDDWIRDTVFSVDGSRLVSVARDTTCKLTDVKTERFIDNVTAITPAILKGGIASVARHPLRDEVVIGGADGIAKVYRLDRQTKRVIGDDANLIRRMPKIHGRIQSVDVSADGNRIAAGSSLDGKGVVSFFSYEFDSSLPADIKAIMRQVVTSRKAEDRQKLEAYLTRDVHQIASAEVPSGVYSLDFHPDGKSAAVGTADGLVRIVEIETGNVLTAFAPVEIAPASQQEKLASNWRLPDINNTKSKLTIPGAAELRLLPTEISLDSKTSYVQLVAQVKSENGDLYDVSHACQYRFDPELIQVGPDGLVQLANPNFAQSSSTNIEVHFQDLAASLPVVVQTGAAWTPDFIQDIGPILSRVGCNAGTCHGSQSGKNGFKLSLRGYDPLFDIRSLADDMSSRRINLASPYDSLMLAKPLGAVPHQGGKVLNIDDKYLQILRQWIAGGAQINFESARVSGIEISPENPVLQSVADGQQMRVVATFADGRTRDVTREAFIEVSDNEVAQVSDTSVVALRRGETAVLARYEGAFTATTLTVMGDRDQFVWQPPETYGSIDEIVAAKWQRLKILPSRLTSDEEFVRRVFLDLTGLPPTPAAISEFLADHRDGRTKREELIDELIGSEPFIEFWSNKWADLLQVNRKYLGVEGATKFREWIRDNVQQNTRYDQFVSTIITATGSNRENPPASYFKILRTPANTMENTTHLFLATRFNCNKCHDHPFERWTQDQYYQTAAFFSQYKLEKDPASGNKMVGGSAVESAAPLFETVVDIHSGDVLHERTGQVAEPAFPFESEYACDENASRREKFAAWLTSSSNPYFATSYVNRLWGYLMGRGLIEPLDDIRAGNPPTNPRLLKYLTEEFVSHDFDMRHVLRQICKSRTYQLSIETNPFNEDDQINYSHALARRLPAEVLFDSIHAVTGSQSLIPGAKPGTRAAMLSDSGAKLPSGFLSTLGRPARESACECERSNELQLGSVLALVSGPDVSRAISDPNNAIAKLVAEITDNRHLVNEIYKRVLGRSAKAKEIELVLETFESILPDHAHLANAKQERELVVSQLKPSLEKEREQAIAESTTQLASAIQQHDPELLKHERERQDQIALAEKQLKEYQGDEATWFAHWKTKQLQSIQWHPVLPHEFSTTSKKSFEIRRDRAILLKQNDQPGVYEVTTEMDLTGVSAIRLELLPDDSLPAKGSGLAPNGNLVLNEFEVEIANPATPDKFQKVEIASAIADFEQNGFSVSNTIDNKIEPASGWAISPQFGQTHWATYQLKMPIGYSGGTLMRFKLHQVFDPKHQIGCFRISVTKYPSPIGLSLPDSFVTQLLKPENELDKSLRKRLKQAFDRDDPELKRLKDALVGAKAPLKIHPEIARLREKLARVSQAVPEDATLLQLEKDLKQSQLQLDNRRLTAAQDLTWALINSPSFLFNR